MESVCEKPEPPNSLTSADCLSNEDCMYLLRALEKRAFEYVVCALRAQGPLSQYKEVILDHLKRLFFISDEEFLARMRCSANDPVLTKIAQELNPSYDNLSEWLAASYSLVSLEFPKIAQLDVGISKNASTCAQQMLSQMNAHNSALEEEKDALQKLLQVNKRTYVPEKLRRLLQESEKDAIGRIDSVKEKKVVSKPPPVGPVRHVGRPRKTEVAAANKDDQKSIVVRNDSVNSNTMTNTASTENGVSPQTKSTQPPARTHDEFSIHYSAGANVVVIDPEDQNTGKEPKIRRRKNKHVDDVTCVCARVQPFIFERQLPGQMKPPRGNPDKRTTKRLAHTGFSASNDVMSNNYMHPQHAVMAPPNYYPKSYMPGNPKPDEFMNSKRPRASSVGEDGAQQQPGVVVPKIFRPSFVQRSPNYASPYKGHAGNGLSHFPQYKATRNLQPGNIPSTNLAKPRSIISEKPGVTSKIPVNIPKSEESNVGNGPASEQTKAIPENDTSGLDGLEFLASTASLLAPIQKSPPNNPDVKKAVLSTATLPAVQVSVQSGIFTNPTENLPICSTVACQPRIESIAITSGLSNSSVSHPVSNINLIPSIPRPAQQQAKPTKIPLQFTKAQATTSRVAIDTSFFANGTRIDEETTLGSILADPALRSKLLSAAKSSSTTVTAASALADHVGAIFPMQQNQIIPAQQQAGPSETNIDTVSTRP